MDYLETHGTGSAMGDPIEVRAAVAVYGKGRVAERPLLIGSLKPNIGHLESAAGVAGLIKVVLAMQETTIPAQPGFRSPSPLIEWDKLPAQVTSRPTQWPLVPDRPHRAGISAFGISGANAHVVVEGYRALNGSATSAAGTIAPAGAARRVAVAVPAPAEETVEDSVPDEGLAARPARLLPLSGKSDEALRELAEQYVAWLDERTAGLSAQAGDFAPALSDMAWTASVGRSHFGHRGGRGVPGCAVAARRSVGAASGGRRLCGRGAGEDCIRFRGRPRPMGRDGRDSPPKRAGRPGRAGALRGGVPGIRRCLVARGDVRTRGEATQTSTIPPGHSRRSTHWNAPSQHCGPASGCDPTS